MITSGGNRSRQLLNPQQAIAYALLVVGLLLVHAVYQLGYGTPVHFDTEPNLLGLEAIGNLQSALFFVFGGDAGPSGRPVSLLTFLINAPAWPLAPDDLLRVNFLIHLLNGALLCWAAFLLASRLVDRDRAALAAAVAACLWLALPILLSSSLLMIQRMTALAATLVLLGVIGHLKARELFQLSPRRGYIAVTLNLGLFTALAVLAKENGAVLPVLILLIERILFRSSPGTDAASWRRWQGIFLLLPLALISAYLLWQLWWPEPAVLRREMQGYERLMSQFVILWQYLFYTVVPLDSGIAPFQDNQPLRSRPDLAVIAAVTGWAAAGWLAWAWRRSRPLLAFALLWYLGAHLVESTTVPLELYFQHRNYLPLMGPCFALGIAIMQSDIRLRLPLLGVALLFFCFSLWMLAQHADRWSDGLTAGELWYQSNPDSSRAASFLIRQQLEAGEPASALETSQQAAAQTSDIEYFELLQVWLACEHTELLETHDLPDKTEVIKRLPQARFSLGLVSTLRRLQANLDNPACTQVTTDVLGSMLLATLANPAFASQEDSGFLLNRATALLMVRTGDFTPAIEHYEHALRHRPNPEAATQLALLYRETGLFARGCLFLNEAYGMGPGKPFLSGAWKRQLAGLELWLGRQSPAGSCTLAIVGGPAS